LFLEWWKTTSPIPSAMAEKIPVHDTGTTLSGDDARETAVCMLATMARNDN